jgi:hypothetical protein
MLPYELKGPFWIFPILVEWHDVVAQIQLHPSVKLLAIQEKELTRFLSANAQFRDGSWWMMKATFMTVAVPIPEGDPEEVVEWRRPGAGPKKESNEAGDPFVMAYTASRYCVIPDHMVNEMIWASFLKFAMHWLTNERQPLDLYFARIYPLLFRKNWKEILIRKEPGKVRRYRHVHGDIIKRGLADHMVTGEMLGFDRSINRCRWTLEIVELDPFRRMTESLERMRGDGYFYGPQLKNRLKIQLSYAIECYSAFLREATFPFINLVTSNVSERAGVTPVRSGKRVIRFHPKSKRCDPVLSEDPGAEQSVPMVSEDAPLPEMPLVRPKESDMREQVGSG